MCGIAGFMDAHGLPPDAETRTRQMLASIRHRGPDEFGIYVDDEVALGSVRLSIIDIAGGQQPIANEDESLWIVFNGEVFNYVELRPELEARGHRFTTHSDTEVVLHLYEELGSACLARLNGQFAFAIWDARKQTLFLARDRMGERPLFYAWHDGTLYFGSEVKALFNGAPISAEIDPQSLREVFTFWSPLPGRSIFRGISEVPPGHFLVASRGTSRVERYWQARLDSEGGRSGGKPPTEAEAEEELERLLVDSIKIRLRADVPVGAYLSGGLDSSTIASIVRRQTTNQLQAFSVAFTDAGFDERDHQRLIANELGVEHHLLEISHADIGNAFPEVVWHAEVPVLRTAPVPMFLLSKRVHEAGLKVVLTGEGADEIFAGYDIFKEAKVRAFWARQPASHRRPLLFKRLHPEVFADGRLGSSFLTAFFGQDLADVEAPDYSHTIRWRTTRRTWRFLSDEVSGGNPTSTRTEVSGLLPVDFPGWGVVERAQFLEMGIFLPQYLLSSQGDRVALAHSVEGRYPFLDPRLVEFANRLPMRLKLRGLREKYLLRAVARRFLPARVPDRRKQAYRAPIHRSFFPEVRLEYVHALLEESALRRSGLFKPAAVSQLRAKLEQGKPLGETDDMALSGILSTQLLCEQFIHAFHKADPAVLGSGGRIIRRTSRRKSKS